MRISNWLRVLVSCAVAGIIALAVYGKWQVGRIYDSASYANTTTVPDIITLDDARAHIARLKLLLYWHVIDRNLTAKAQLEPRIREELRGADESMQKYEHQIIDGQDKRMLQDDRRLLVGYAAGIADILEQSRTNNDGVAKAELSMQRELGDKLEDALNKHVRYSVTQGANRDNLAIRTFHQASWTTVAFVLGIVSILLAIGYTIGRRITGQIDHIRKLARDNEMFRTIAENSPDMIVRYDLECRRIYVNRAFLDAAGLPAKDVLGKPMSELAWWAVNISAEEFKQHLRYVIHTGKPVSVRLYGSPPSVGQMRHTFARIVPEYGADGQVLRLMSVVRDITDLVLAQQELQQREQYQRALLDNFPFFVWLKDTESRLLAANAQYARVARVDTTRDLEGKTDFDFFPPDLAQSYVEDDRHVLESGEPKNVVEMYSDEHGRRRWMETYKSPVAVDGTVAGTVGFSRDITEQMQLQLDLASRERELRTLVENSPDIIIRYDRECHRTFISQNYEQVYGYPISETLGKKPTESWNKPLMDPAIYESRLIRVMQTGIPETIELDWYTEEGEYICQSLLAVPEHDAARQITSVLTISRDVSEIKRAERKLEARELEFRTLSENSPNAIVRYDRDCRRIYVNPGFERISGLSRQAALGKTPLESLSQASVAVFYEEQLQQVLISGTPAEFDMAWPSPNGEERWEHFRLVPEYGTQGEVTSLLSVSHDITARKRAEQMLQTREQEFRTLVENSPDMVVRYDRNFQRLFVNAAYARETGTPVEQALNCSTDDADIWKPTMPHEEYNARLQQVMDSGKPANILLEWVSDDGRQVSHDMRVVPEYGPDGNITGTLAIGHNISKLKQAELVLRQREHEFRALVENSPDTVTRFDRDCRRVYANPSMVEESGLPLLELLGKTPEEFPGGEQAASYQERIRQVLDSGQPGNFELHWLTGDGDEVCSHIRLTPEFGTDGHVAQVLAVGRDITEIDAYRKQIHSLAFFDNLTSLPNRSLLLDRIRQTIADASWHGSRFGLMLLDLDRFKEVNDTLGHGVGDLLLREVADRLLICVRGYDTVARLGGDEFAILLPEMRVGADLATIACKILDMFQQPFNLSGRELFISASIGIALYPDDSAEIDALFKYADSAMYHAKKQGRNNFQFYSRELTTRSSERMALESALRRARRNDELELYYQPQVRLDTGRIIGAEALLRWNRGEHGMVMPDRFIPVAEETGLIVGIGEWILATACRAAVDWNQSRTEPFKVAVNLSTRQFIQNDLLKSVRGILMETECKPEWLKLEITESLLLEDSADVIAMLEELDAMGLAISIDDFGTGYSALSYLNRFPVSQIKIDRSFVQGIPEDRDKSELVKAMISIAQSLQLELVAEGVETSLQADYLSTHGCGIAQGYLFGKPMPQYEFEKKLAG